MNALDEVVSLMERANSKLDREAEEAWAAMPIEHHVIAIRTHLQHLARDHQAIRSDLAFIARVLDSMAREQANTRRTGRVKGY